MKGALRFVLLVLWGVAWGVSLFGFLSGDFFREEFYQKISVQRMGAQIREQAALKDIALGIQNYRIEYARWPVNGKGETKAEVSGDLLRVLLGENVNGLNPRKVSFIELRLARDVKRGPSIEDQQRPSLVDAWGHPYFVIIDADNSGKLTNPDLQNPDAQIRARATPMLERGVIAYCLAEDGIGGTADDITSWRRERVAPSRSWAQAAQLEGIPLAFVIIFVSGLGVVVRRFWRCLNA